MKKQFIISVILLLGYTVFGQTEEQLEHLDNYYQKALKEWNIPGMAIAIVKKDKIIFSKGYGYANLKKKTKVDGNTLFAIASNSKAFTSSALAQLVDQKKIKWTDNVIDYVPEFKLYDDYTTNNTTIEDLLCHRNGLKTFSGDLLWYGTNLTQKEIINKQQYLKPNGKFRANYGYSNIQFIAAGLVLEKVTDTTWSDYMKNHFLHPLEMDRTITSTSTNDLKNSTNVATPYYLKNGENIALEWVNWDNMAPAGGIISSVNDYAKWLMLNINKGTFNNETYFSKRRFTELTTPKINHIVNENEEKVNFKSYGLGWGLQDYQGYKIVGHSGGYDGMISKSTFVPEKKIGIIVLTNSLNWLPGAIVNKSLDVLLAEKLDGKDWSKIYLDFKTKQDKATAEKQAKDKEKKGKLGVNPFDLNEYVGTYKDKMYGTVTVSKNGSKLHFSMDNTTIFQADLNHWNNTIFTFNFDENLSSLPEGKARFALDNDGNISTLHLFVPNPDFFFEEFYFEKVR